MTDRDAKILELAKSGLPAAKIKERLNLSITPESIGHIVRKHLGPAPKGGNSRKHKIPWFMRRHVIACMIMLGKDPHTCEICKEIQDTPCDIHHTKYEGATVYDLQFVCRSCNLSWANKGLA